MVGEKKMLLLYPTMYLVYKWMPCLDSISLDKQGSFFFSPF